MSNGQRVLVVDGLSEIQEVLQAILEPRGLQVERMRSHVHTPQSTSSERPDILVIDAEAVPMTSRESSAWAEVPQVIIGSERFATANELPDPNRRYLEKPFHYKELIQAIELLLPRRAA